MLEFNEKELQSLIEEALSTSDANHPFSSFHLGFSETDLLEIIYQKLSSRIIQSDLNNIFLDVRKEILSRKLSLTLQDFHTITKNCKKCSSITSDSELPKWNIVNPDIVVVVENPNLSPEAVSLMIDTFKKAGLSSQQLCLTYINRCPVKRKYENQEIINCSSYLHTEIQLLNPKLIMCFGALPASVLFGQDIKLKDIRGNITWLGYWPILTTYSPNYVLKSSSFESTQASEHFYNDILQAYNFVSLNRK